MTKFKYLGIDDKTYHKEVKNTLENNEQLPYERMISIEIAYQLKRIADNLKR